MRVAADNADLQQSELFQPIAERVATEVEQFGGLGLVVVRPCKGLANEFIFQFFNILVENNALERELSYSTLTMGDRWIL